jgi:hypothetical protein
MPHEISFEMVPLGHSAEAAREATTVKVCMTAFLSSEDGQEFIRRLEGFPTELLSKLPPNRRVNPSQADHIVAVIRRDKSATVYVNELDIILGTVIGRSIGKGEYVSKNDIVDIATMEFNGVTVPDDAGVVVVFSVGWRKGLFYDFSPLHPKENILRTAQLPGLLGQCYAHVSFQERFSILESEWDALFKSKWFPFAGLRNEMIDELLSHIRAGWNPDDLTTKIAEEIKSKLPGWVEAWRSHPAFANHLKTLEKVGDHFQKGDYLSASGLLFPRIEGLLRSNHAAMGSAAKPSQKNLPGTAVQARSGRRACLLLPHKFEQYLSEVYFASFEPAAARIEISRNSVGHGVASEDEFNEKAAVIGLLVAQQLLYCFERPSIPGTLAVQVCPSGRPAGNTGPGEEGRTETEDDPAFA